ncbi:MAG: N-acetyltransferase [Candidatus Dormibacteraeota bacterium]|nr:N-acetyltransferase [Candidatus Dormibacteraeota bacterium]
MKKVIRRGAAGDVEPMLDLADAHRRQYAKFHPRFHRPAAAARDAQRPFFEKLISDNSCIVLVSESEEGRLDGFLTGQLTAPPPVYDPGGAGCIVDDFALASPEAWPIVGLGLLTELRWLARERGAVQVIVVCAPEDEPKRVMLAGAGLSVVSEWLQGEL